MKNPHGRHAITGASAFRPCTLPDASSRRVEPEKTEIQQATAAAAATTHSSIKGQIPICFPTQEKVHRWTATVCVRSKKASRSSAEQQQQQQLHLEPLAFAFALIRSFVLSFVLALFPSGRNVEGICCAIAHCCHVFKQANIPPLSYFRIISTTNGVLLHNNNNSNIRFHSILIQSPFFSILLATA